MSVSTVASADCANLLIRDGMNICGAKVRPKRQKNEPVQCMKCRCWGHFATECQIKGEKCGTCEGTHCTNACNVKGKLYCVSCDNNSHASWDRNCPEFMRCCAIYNDRNPENSMPYYPTDQDWTLTTCPERIPMELRYPGKYAVNSLPATNRRK